MKSTITRKAGGFALPMEPTLIKTKPYPDITLEFDTEKHRFFANGEPVPSVTHFTKVIAKPALMFWQEKITKEELLARLEKNKGLKVSDIIEATALHRTRKEEAASIGTLAHDWAENFAKGVKQPIRQSRRSRMLCSHSLNGSRKTKLSLWRVKNMDTAKNINLLA